MALNTVDDRTQLSLRNQVELLCFRVSQNGTQFATNVFKVREAVKYKPLTEIADSNGAICGLLTLRKEIIPVVNLKMWLYKGGIGTKQTFTDFGQDLNDSQIIVCEFNNTTIGLWVYRADYILRRNWEDIHVPVSSEFGSKTNNYTKNDKGEIVYIVDIEGMLAELFPMIVAQNESDTSNLETFEIENKVVLIAEDSRSALKALTRVLDKLRVRYVAFENGRRLLDYIESVDVGTIGLVITDLEMPEASGFTVIKELKGNKSTEHLPIVVNSSMTGASNQEIAKSLNADGFIGKTNPREIAGFIHQFLGKK